MAQQLTKKAALAANSKAEEARQRAIAARKQLNDLFAGKAQKAGTSGPTAFLSGLGGLSNLPTVPEARAKTDPETDLHPRVRALKGRHGYDSLSAETRTLLSAIVKRHEETNGGDVEILVSDAAAVTGLPIERAARAVDALIVNGFIAPRRSTLGPCKGYVPTLG